MLLPPTLLLLVPLAYLGAALLPDRLFARWPEGRWTIALTATAVALLAALAAAAAVATSGTASVGSLGPGRAPGALAPSVRLDALTAVMLVLVTGIAAAILRFSRRYLDGEPGYSRYVRWFLATAAFVSLLVITNDLIVLAIAWTVCGLTLHQLLIFYGDRGAALVAAHKKFLLGRVADIVFLAGVVLVWRTMGSQRIDVLLAEGATLRTVPPALEVAGVLLALGVVIRSAQLPFHGWLIQVMEAPTPVSAFLHAGIVNVGGFVLIRLAGLVAHLEGAQTLLVVVGTMTAVLAALVATTRVSVKVSLAWSTCAQMGFMLLECGLGAYGLALLHLVAHSCYKSHAFLSSGRAVEQQLVRQMAPAPARVTGRQWALGGAATVIAMMAIGSVLALRAEDDPATRVAFFILALALVPMLLRGMSRGARSALRSIGAAVFLVAAYAIGHAFFAGLAPSLHGDRSMELLRLGFVASAFVALYAVQATIATQPSGRVARALYPMCFAGFYLDEMWTRLTFRVWPPRALAASPRVKTSSIRALQELHA